MCGIVVRPQSTGDRGATHAGRARGPNVRPAGPQPRMTNAHPAPPAERTSCGALGPVNQRSLGGGVALRCGRGGGQGRLSGDARAGRGPRPACRVLHRHRHRGHRDLRHVARRRRGDRGPRDRHSGVIGQWTFSGSDTLKRVHDAPAISIARPTQDPVRGTRRLALLAAVGFAIVVIGRELAPGMLLDALVAVLVLAVYHLAEWVAVRRIEERRGAIAYRRSPAGDGPPLVVCRPDPALEAFGR